VTRVAAWCGGAGGAVGGGGDDLPTQHRRHNLQVNAGDNANYSLMQTGILSLAASVPPPQTAYLVFIIALYIPEISPKNSRIIFTNLILGWLNPCACDDFSVPALCFRSLLKSGILLLSPTAFPSIQFFFFSCQHCRADARCDQLPYVPLAVGCARNVQSSWPELKRA
jgi:hypothetical protein